jgi:hypothetical protein
MATVSIETARIQKKLKLEFSIFHTVDPEATKLYRNDNQQDLMNIPC